MIQQEPEESEIFELRVIPPYRLKKMKIHFALKRPVRFSWEQEAIYCRKRGYRFTQNWALVTCQACLDKHEKELAEQERQRQAEAARLQREQEQQEQKAREKAVWIETWAQRLELYPKVGEWDELYEQRLKKAIAEYREREREEEHQRLLIDESQGFLVLEDDRYDLTPEFDRLELSEFVTFDLGINTPQVRATGLKDFMVEDCYNDAWTVYIIERQEYLRLLKALQDAIAKEIALLEN